MITGQLKSDIDRIWDAFWSGGISNPLEVIEQITYLLFIKRLDELHTLEEKKANELLRASCRSSIKRQGISLHYYPQNKTSIDLSLLKSLMTFCFSLKH